MVCKRVDSRQAYTLATLCVCVSRPLWVCVLGVRACTRLCRHACVRAGGRAGGVPGGRAGGRVRKRGQDRPQCEQDPCQQKDSADTAPPMPLSLAPPYSPYFSSRPPFLRVVGRSLLSFAFTVLQHPTKHFHTATVRPGQRRQAA
jgi:hypothetical protein